MTEYIGEYVTATVSGSSVILAIATVGQSLFLTRDEALDLQEAINAVIGAMPVDIRQAKAVKA